MNAVDTNVFIYALDDDTPIKQGQAHVLLDRLALATEPTVLPWQVANELLSNLRKRESAGRITPALVETHFRRFISMFPLTVPNERIFQFYFNLHGRFSLSHWDAMLLAASKVAGVTTLF